jgi:hypothetical protein
MEKNNLNMAEKLFRRLQYHAADSSISLFQHLM